MNPQIKQKWLNALRSGKYQQTQRRLHDENGFCCLGVLCDLYGKEHNVEWEINEDFGKYMFQNKVACLPFSVIEWSGIADSGPLVYYGPGAGEICTLADLNDKGSTFIEIADVIEEHL
jgi:hypothetical protein